MIDIKLNEFKEELTEEAVHPGDLMRWNKAQMRAWKQFVKKHNITEYERFVKKHNKNRKTEINANDISLLMKYAAWFREFFLNRGKIPTVKEIPSLKYIRSFQPKRLDSLSKK